MLHGAAWAARRDRASALVEDPQQRHLADWREQRTRRRAELEEKTARRQAEFTALLRDIAAEVAADVSAAVAAALRTTRVGHHEGLVQAPTTTPAPTTSVADDHDLNRAPATTTTVKPPVSTGLGNDHDMTASYGADLATPTPSTCSTICLAGDTSADLAASAPTTCSAELPSHAASVYAAALTPSSAEPTSSTTTACVSEQCCFDPEPVVAILATVQSPGNCDMFRTLPRTLWSPKISDVCTSLVEVQHLVILEQTESGLSLELHNLVISDGPRSRPIPWPWPLIPRDGWQYKLPWTPIQVPSSQKFYLAGTFQKHLIILVVFNPWPYWELSILVVYCHSTSMHFQRRFSMQRYTCSGGFFVILNGTAEVQRHYYCPRALAGCDRKGWISRQIQRGNTQCSELIEWSSLQSAIQFHTLGNILCFCCVLEQWEISGTVSHVSLKSEFQYCRDGYESLYVCENFPGTIAWFLSPHSSLSSLQTWQYSVILVSQNCHAIYQEKWFRFLIVLAFTAGSAGICNGAVTITSWPHFKVGVLPLVNSRNLSLWRFLSVDQMMLKIGHVVHCGLDLVQWKIAWSIHLEYSNVVNQSKQLMPAATMIYHVLYSPWDPGIWALLCSYRFSAQDKTTNRIKVEALAYYHSHCLGHGTKLRTLEDELGYACTSVEHSVGKPKHPWSHFAPTNSPSELMSDLRNVSESLYISGNSFELHMNCFAAWYVFCARFRLKAYYSVQDSGCLTSHFIQRAYFLMQWKIPWLFSYPVVTIILWLQFATQNSFDPSCDQFVTEDSGISGNFANMWMMFRIIWLLDLVCSASGNKSDPLILPTMGESATYLEKRNALVLPFYTRTVQNSLLVIWSWPYHSEHCACHYPTSGKVEATGVRNAAPTIHVIEQAHAGHDYYFDNVHADDNYYYDAFLDRVDHRLGLFNLIQVLVDQSYYRNCDNRERQVQWDPGGSTWHRLEVKPNFKEEGMLATSPAASTALGLGCRYWAWAAGMTRRQRLQISAEAIRPTWLGLGRLRPPCLCLRSSSLRVPLLL